MERQQRAAGAPAALPSAWPPWQRCQPRGEDHAVAEYRRAQSHSLPPHALLPRWANACLGRCSFRRAGLDRSRSCQRALPLDSRAGNLRGGAGSVLRGAPRGHMPFEARSTKGLPFGKPFGPIDSSGTPSRARTYNLLIRSQILYPIELWAQGGEAGIRTQGESFDPHALSRRAPSANSVTSPGISGGGRGTRTPKSKAPRFSRPLPYQLG